MSVWFAFAGLGYKMGELCEVWHGLQESDLCGVVGFTGASTRFPKGGLQLCFVLFVSGLYI